MNDLYKSYIPPMSRTLSLSAYLVLVTFFSAAFPARAIAESPDLDFPVDCRLESDCWILSYVDVDRSKTANQDYKCGSRAFEGSNGLLIAVQSLAATRKVTAAAQGRVTAAIDNYKGPVSENPCGNGVLIAHKGGWETRYCHMKAGSIKVKPGQIVGKGNEIGTVGMSGKTGWPALHFDIRKGRYFYDPFSGRSQIEGCGLETKPVWSGQKELPYYPFGIIDAGFSAKVPKEAAIRKGLPRLLEMPGNVRQLIFWGFIIGTKVGDYVSLKVNDPYGREFMELNGEIKQDKNRRLVFVRRPLERNNWSPGIYKGILKISRPGHKPIIHTTSIEILDAVNR